MNIAIAITALLPVSLLFGKARFGRINQFVELISTFWHEMSHAISASIMYGEVDSIRVEPGGRVREVQGAQSYSYVYSASGVTHYRTNGSGIRRFFITGAGYAGPTLLGLAMIFTWSTSGLAIFGYVWGIILALFFIVSRGVYAFLINLVSFLLVTAPVWPDSFASFVPFLDDVRYIAPTLLISTLLVYGLKDSVGIFRTMRQIARGEVPATGDSDTEKMAQMTGIPATFWAISYVVLSIVGLMAIPGLLIWQTA